MLPMTLKDCEDVSLGEKVTISNMRSLHTVKLEKETVLMVETVETSREFYRQVVKKIKVVGVRNVMYALSSLVSIFGLDCILLIITGNKLLRL